MWKKKDHPFGVVGIPRTTSSNVTWYTDHYPAMLGKPHGVDD